MKIQTLTEYLNIETLPYLSLNSCNKDSQYSNKCEVTILVIYQPYISPFIIVAADLIWFSEDIVINLNKTITVSILEHIPVALSQVLGFHLCPQVWCQN